MTSSSTIANVADMLSVCDLPELFEELLINEGGANVLEALDEALERIRDRVSEAVEDEEAADAVLLRIEGARDLVSRAGEALERADDVMTTLEARQN